ncbi:MAG: fumarylacetoacetate hydrolase family protein [Chloroflexi bacterium]|nr:fumarylacetoacetate hydrolase family protein [Chloroflexota bacterium]
MLYVRYEKDGETRYGWLDGMRVGAVTGDVFGSFRREGIVADAREVRILPPVTPSKIIAVGQNYQSRAAEEGLPRPDIPPLFLKPPSAVIGHNEAIVLPPQSSQVEHEAELAVIIGRRARWVSVEDALKFVWGYTCANDVTARDIERRDSHLTRGKGFDTFCPLGPWVSTDVDPADVVITCMVNGQVRQMTSTREMIFSVPQLIAFISSAMTLEPGDVILTGTTAGVGPLAAGDRVDVDIEGIGALMNTVVALGQLTG